ncbi:combover [Musca autumnalis]|uniref:combover n=1 Tax=Musca autumnalis TaxID=221902 RepID=UPI003CF2BE8F
MSPAPTKNPNKDSRNIVPSSGSSSFHNPPSTSSTSGTSSPMGGGRKQTGTVPKAATTATKISSSSTTASKQQSVIPEVNDQQPSHKPILQQPTVLAQQQQHLSNRCSPLNIVASIQQQQQHAARSHQHHHHHHQHAAPVTGQQLHKNTEIVAPIRRELKDLNDYLLTTVVTTTAAAANTTTSSNNNPATTLLQQQQGLGATASSDIENSQENQQRFCYPVRPIPRRSQPQIQNQQQQQLQNDFLNTAAANVGNTNLNTTIGVVIPHTPGVPPPNQSSTANNSATTAAAATVQPIQPSAANLVAQNISQTINDNQAVLGAQFEQQIQLIVLQRLRQLFENSQTSPFLNLTTSLLPGIQASSSAALANTILHHNTNEITQLAQRFQNLNNNSQKPLKPKTTATTMVHEINPSTSGQHDVVVNSTSLEDVPQSNMSDRAQSIQSLHSNIETPTPETTPSYEELQARLEASNRNIQNMQEQQQQLLKLQNAAKQHLSDMEKLRQQAGHLSFAPGTTSDGAPDYESVGQVQSDVANLVGRMKNLTTFIQNQNELSSMMGEDCPEILAEQQVLQRKLEALRAQRDEMRNLVTELQSVNRSAEESAKEARQRQFEQEKDIEENDQQEQATAAAVVAQAKKSSNNEREVPVEFTRNVPIELLQHAQRPQEQRQRAPQMNGNEQSENEETDMDEDERKETAHLIQQKVADIEAMKAQLKRLKDMMETVSLIEAHTSKDESRTPTREVPIVYDRERTPIAMPSRFNDNNGNEEVLARKVRMLNEVTSDLREQAESLQAEKDRIQMLKAEIERRKQQAAAAVQMGDDALKRNSLTPTPMQQQQHHDTRSHEERWQEHLRTQHERDALKEEYERKKKEFEVICKRLEQEETPAQQQTSNATTRQDIVSEADDEAEEDNMESDYAESAKFVPTSTPATSRNNENTSSNARGGKDSLNSTGVSSNAGTHIAQAASSSAHDGASLEGASMQSGSSRSFSIPPPMSAMGINFPGPIPPPLPTAWNPYYYAAGVPPPPPPPPQTTSYGLTQNAGHNVTLSNSECICTANNLGHATASSSTATSAATNNGTLASDPMLQQFIQTQQMLINSVCQCNQMLWHQQREIDNLNQTIHILQERLISLGGTPISNPEVSGYTLRSESVPPPSLAGIPSTQALPNNLYMTINRAQSEQPTSLYMPQRNNGFGGSYQQQQQQHHQHHVYRRVSQQQPLHNTPGGGGYNFSAETQQHNSSSTASASMYSTLNNATVIPPQPNGGTTLFNNEIPTPPSPVVGSSGGPAPIFMHHHNNSIHQNNANLRTQNQQQQQQHHHSNIAAGNTLNNQVPPGNRANNYWDNFRSYSRQNLLSTNSNKSNEEQQQILQQQQQQQQQESNGYERPQSMQQHPSATAPPPPQQQPQIFHEQNLNLEDCVNNLNYAAAVSPNSNDAASKYLRILQRSRINQQQQQLQYQQNAYQQQRELQQLNWLEQQQQQQHHENNNSNSGNAGSSANTNNATNNSSGGSTTDLMYHNYNIQQNNKVGPKPNWRFRNLNEDYNLAINHRLQQSSRQPPLPRYQNTSFAQQHSTPQYLNLQQTHQTATGNRNHDFLLQVNDDGDGNAFNFHHQLQQMPLDYSTTNQQNIIPSTNSECNNENNEEEEDDEEDDTTSEEIKRNLLVNALKNDKFTTKFYESIKEDVFRRLESMLLDKDNLATQSQANVPQLFNNIGNHSLRKLNLNEQRDQLQQQLQQQHSISSTSSQFDNANVQQQQQQNVSDDSNAPRNDYYAPAMTAANVNNEDPNGDNENEKPEEDSNWRQNNINNCNPQQQQQQQAATVAAAAVGPSNSTTSVKNCSKKRKNLRKQAPPSNNNNAASSCNKEEEHNDNLRGACSLAAQQHHKQQQQQVNKDKQNEMKNGADNSNTANVLCLTASSNTPSVAAQASSSNANHSTTPQANEGDLIKYIISRIRNQTHTNTLINDTLLVEVAKLTASVAQNAHNTTCNNTNGNIISPKKIYTKIKKLTIPKERDEFLTWYQHYLENTLFGNIPNEGKMKASKTSNNNSINIQQQQQNGIQASIPPIAAPPPQQQDDGDLAEADQNCSSNNSANYLQDVDSTPTDMNLSENSNKLVVLEAAANEDNNLEGACALVSSSSSNTTTTTNHLDGLQSVPLVAAIEKTGIKSEKQDTNEKE